MCVGSSGSILSPPVWMEGDTFDSASRLAFYQMWSAYYRVVGANERRGGRGCAWSGHAQLGDGTIGDVASSERTQCRCCGGDLLADVVGGGACTCGGVDVAISQSLCCGECGEHSNFGCDQRLQLVRQRLGVRVGSALHAGAKESCGDLRSTVRGERDATDRGVGDATEESSTVQDTIGVDRLGFDSERLNVPVRGPNYLRNQANRKAHKLRMSEKKKQDQEKKMAVVNEEEEKKTLMASLNEKRKAENELATERAVRKLAAMRLISVEDQVKCNRAKMNAATERNLVSIEKTHAKLTASGNVPGDMTGFAATINGSNSISPDSSASNQEIRQCQKALADAEFKLKKVQEMTGVDVDAIVVSPEHEMKDHHLLDIFTDNSTNKRYIDENYGDYIIESASFLGFEGKNRIRAF